MGILGPPILLYIPNPITHILTKYALVTHFERFTEQFLYNISITNAINGLCCHNTVDGNNPSGDIKSSYDVACTMRAV